MNKKKKIIFLLIILDWLVFSGAVSYAQKTEWKYRLTDGNGKSVNFNFSVIKEKNDVIQLDSKFEGSVSEIQGVPFFNKRYSNNPRTTTLKTHKIGNQKYLVMSEFKPGNRKTWKLEYGDSKKGKRRSSKVSVRTGGVSFNVLEEIPVLNIEGFLYAFSKGYFQKKGEKIYIADLKWKKNIKIISGFKYGKSFEVKKDKNGFPVLIRSLVRQNKWELKLMAPPARPINLKVKIDNSNKIVTLAWNRPKDGSIHEYSILRKLGDENEYDKIGSTSVTKYTDSLKTLKENLWTNISYVVGFIGKDKNIEYFSRAIAPPLFFNPPPKLEILKWDFRGNLLIGWTPNERAEKYKIYWRPENKNEWNTYVTKNTEYTEKNKQILSKCCTKYYYRVSYYKESPIISESEPSKELEVVMICKARDYGLKAKDITSSSLKLEWDKTKLGSYDRLFISKKSEKEDNFKKIKSISKKLGRGEESFDYDVENLEHNTSYFFKIEEKRDDTESPCGISLLRQATTKLKTPQNIRIHSDAITWDHIKARGVSYVLEITNNTNNTVRTIDTEKNKVYLSQITSALPGDTIAVSIYAKVRRVTSAPSESIPFKVPDKKEHKNQKGNMSDVSQDDDI